MHDNLNLNLNYYVQWTASLISNNIVFSRLQTGLETNLGKAFPLFSWTTGAVRAKTHFFFFTKNTTFLNFK